MLTGLTASTVRPAGAAHGPPRHRVAPAAGRADGSAVPRGSDIRAPRCPVASARPSSRPAAVQLGQHRLAAGGAEQLVAALARRAGPARWSAGRNPAPQPAAAGVPVRRGSDRSAGRPPASASRLSPDRRATGARSPGGTAGGRPPTRPSAGSAGPPRRIPAAGRGRSGTAPRPPRRGTADRRHRPRARRRSSRRRCMPSSGRVRPPRIIRNAGGWCATSCRTTSSAGVPAMVCRSSRISRMTDRRRPLSRVLSRSSVDVQLRPVSSGYGGERRCEMRQQDPQASRGPDRGSPRPVGPLVPRRASAESSCRSRPARPRARAERHPASRPDPAGGPDADRSLRAGARDSAAPGCGRSRVGPWSVPRQPSIARLLSLPLRRIASRSRTCPRSVVDSTVRTTVARRLLYRRQTAAKKYPNDATVAQKRAIRPGSPG